MHMASIFKPGFYRVLEEDGMDAHLEKTRTNSKIGQVPTRIDLGAAVSEAERFEKAIITCAQKSRTSQRLVGQSKPRLAHVSRG